MRKLPDILIHDGFRIDEAQLAQAVAQRTGLKKDIDIAQTAEDVRHLLDILAEVWAVAPGAVCNTVARHQRGGR